MKSTIALTSENLTSLRKTTVGCLYISCWLKSSFKNAMLKHITDHQSLKQFYLPQSKESKQIGQNGALLQIGPQQRVLHHKGSLFLKECPAQKREWCDDYSI